MLVKLLTEHGVEAHDRRLGRGRERPQGGLRRLQGHAHVAPGPAQAAVAAPRAAGRGVRLPQRLGRGLGGRRRDRHAGRARRASEGLQVTIVTGDRDAFQLIDPEARVKVMATARGITDTKLYDHEAVIDRYGIPPELIPDFYGLKGDTSDNIPGVPGIGDKTASELLQRFGDLETVLGSVDEISRRQAQAEPHRARRRRADLQAAGDDPARRAGRRHRPAGRRGARARPLAAARRLPRVRAARPAAAAGGGARATPTRPRRAPAADRRCTRACARATVADIAHAARRRASRSRCRRPRPPRASCSREETMWRFGAAAGEQVLVGDAPTGRRRWSLALRRPAGARARRQVVRRGPAEPRPRHAAGRVPARARAARLPVPRALRGARPRHRRRGRRRPRRACWCARWRRGSASRSPSAACGR